MFPPFKTAAIFLGFEMDDGEPACKFNIRKQEFVVPINDMYTSTVGLKMGEIYPLEISGWWAYSNQVPVTDPGLSSWKWSGIREKES